VDEGVKAGLLGLVDDAVKRGWSARRAAGLLGLDHVRLGRWQARRDAGQLTDRAPVGHPLHGQLEAERAAIVALFEAWGQIDCSHRKLAHDGLRYTAFATNSRPGWPHRLSADLELRHRRRGDG
jgi:hypothetical protein